jgi:group II intron reverse transcriptase/maturase
MRNAETVLDIIRERGNKGLVLEDVYRQLYNPELYLKAYGKIYRNKGAMTPGVTPETADGMSLEKIQAIIEALRYERYQWLPARRQYIEKKNSTKKRPLGLPVWSDKVLQEVIRLILEAYYEPQFSDHSHGFRPKRGCHTALRKIYRTWIGTIWFIEGDISACFDRFDHTVLLTILRDKIHDNRFLRLIENLLKAGYMEDWRFNKTLSGTPQGGVISPILSNIYLDQLDQFVESTLIPEYTRGQQRERNLAYNRLTAAISRLRKQGKRDESKALYKRAKAIPTLNPYDANYRRLKYERYADDFLLGLIGSRAEAEEIKSRIGEFLQSKLKLELSETKTLLTHASTEAARFLSYEVSINRDQSKRNTQGHRSLGGHVTLRIPADVVQKKCTTYMKHGKPTHLFIRTHNEVFTIIADYQAEYRGIVNYWRMAINLRDLGRLKWIMETSLTKTLASKLKLSVQQVYSRFRATIDTPNGPRTGLRTTVEREGKRPLVAIWGGIKLIRDVKAPLNDDPPRIWSDRSELIDRLLANTCELCGSQEGIRVHHIRALRDLRKWGPKEPPEWVQKMAARQRKTLVVCHQCHHHIHRDGTKGDVRARRERKRASGEPDAAKVASPVLRGE